MKIFKNNTVFNFMEKRIPFLVLSLLLVFSSLSLLSFKGLNLGVDFQGGTIVQIKYLDSVAPISNVRSLLESSKFSNSNVSKFGNDHEIIIKLKNSSSSIDNDIGDEIKSLLSSTGNIDIRRVDMVGPKVGNELKEKGLQALLLSLLVILIYVSFRFEWKFALASIAALFHDVIIALGVLSLLQIEVNLDVLAAILTILGYSLNDTIIVFDRIREELSSPKDKNINSIINTSVSKTLSRTTLTSLTTFFVVLTLFIFGSKIIEPFSLTLLVGVIVGTYSSIFVASSFLVQFNFSVENYINKLALKKSEQAERDRERALFEQGSV
jgi:preprotein translocase subunit SecF